MYKDFVSITTKANLRKLISDGTTFSLGGNLTLAVKVWDSKTDNSGNSDQISVQLSGPSGSGIWFTNNW